MGIASKVFPRFQPGLEALTQVAADIGVKFPEHVTPAARATVSREATRERREKSIFASTIDDERRQVTQPTSSEGLDSLLNQTEGR